MNAVRSTYIHKFYLHISHREHNHALCLNLTPLRIFFSFQACLQVELYDFDVHNIDFSVLEVQYILKIIHCNDNNPTIICSDNHGDRHGHDSSDNGPPNQVLPFPKKPGLTVTGRSESERMCSQARRGVKGLL